MIELGELEARHEDFARRNAQVVAVSEESQEDAAKTREQFPHLLVVADLEGRLITAANVLHPHAGPNGRDIAVPTTILVDRTGTVRWLFRSSSYLARLSPDELLAALDRTIP
jgi:alkyl hydroperoxide reductase subunit AhpC